ncbi:hypothetical protein ACWDRB_57035 [Nonomuraea sp. NPDC003707]
MPAGLPGPAAHRRGENPTTRVWRGLLDADAAGRTLIEHEAIYAALVAADAIRAQAAALMHITTTETWLRAHIQEWQPT